MSRTCTVCSNAEASKINAELCAKQDSNRVIAQRYNLSPDALQRHKKCIDKKLARVAEARDHAEVTTIESRVERALNRVEKWIGKLDETNDYRAQTAHTRELRGFLELHGRLTGKLNPSPLVQVQVAAPAPAGQPSDQEFRDMPLEDLAELLSSEIPEQIGAERYAQLIRLLASQLPVNTTAESVPATTQLAITPQSRFAPGR
jgi:hypothetical protein